MEPAESRAVLTVPLGDGGVSGDLARLHLDDGSTLVAKRPARDPIVRERQRALGMYEREARFYSELASRVPLRTPACVSASADLILLEDLAPAVAGTFRDGLTPDQVDAVVSDFARLHSQWQGARELDDLGWLWRVRADEAARWQANLAERLPRFVDRHRARLREDDVRLAEDLTASLTEVMTAAASLPATFCHGDPGPPNLMFGHPSAPVAYIDWQLAAARHGALDLAWLLTLGVPVEMRRAHEAGWVARYGAEVGAADDLPRAYALGVALALRAPIWMGGAPERERSAHVDAYAEATLDRAFSAAAQHDVRTILRKGPAHG